MKEKKTSEFFTRQSSMSSISLPCFD